MWFINMKSGKKQCCICSWIFQTEETAILCLWNVRSQSGVSQVFRHWSAIVQMKRHFNFSAIDSSTTLEYKSIKVCVTRTASHHIHLHLFISSRMFTIRRKNLLCFLHRTTKFIYFISFFLVSLAKYINFMCYFNQNDKDVGLWKREQTENTIILHKFENIKIVEKFNIISSILV